MKHLFRLLLLLICFTSCKKELQLEQNIANINTNITVERFDKLFAEATVKDLPKLKKNYPFMFAETYPDRFWFSKIEDTLQKQIFKEVEKTFKNFEETELEIESLVNHIKYYFPEFKTPRFITTTSYVDYRNKIFLTDTIVLISIDTYLGSNHEFYQSIPKYISANLSKEQLVVDLATKYAEKYIFQEAKKTLLDEMIYFGKQLYFKDLIIPFKTQAERIAYTEEELNWAMTNENYIWRYFVERELLFSTDSKLPSRFINPAPFSKFYLEEIDTDSPGRLGRYIGWQIVRAFMSQNNVTLKELLVMNTEDIFNNSKFKPKK